MTRLTRETYHQISKLTMHAKKIEKSKDRSPKHRGTTSYQLCSYVWNGKIKKSQLQGNM